MKRKRIWVTAVCALALSVSACGSQTNTENGETDSSHIAEEPEAGAIETDPDESGSDTAEAAPRQQEVSLNFSPISPFSEGLTPVCKNGKWGYMDTSGKLVIDYQFDEVSPFSEGLAATSTVRLVTVDNIEKYVTYYSLIDTTGNCVAADLPYESMRPFSEGLAVVQGDGGYGYIDTSGNLVIETQFTEARDFHQGYALVTVYETLYGTPVRTYKYIDKTGEVVPDLSGYNTDEIYYDGFVYGFTEEGLARVRSGSAYGFIDKTGSEVMGWYSYAHSFSEGLARIYMQDLLMNGGWGFVNTSGDMVVDTIYGSAGDFSGGLARVEKNDVPGEDEDYGYIDTEGNVVIDFQFKKAGDFSEGYAWVGNGETYGYIDTTGALVIDYQYDSASDFSDGRALVEKNGKRAFIDTEGNVVIGSLEDSAE